MSMENIIKRNALVDKLIEKIKHDYDEKFEQHCNRIKEVDMNNPDAVHPLSVTGLSLIWTKDAIIGNNGKFFRTIKREYRIGTAEFWIESDFIERLLYTDLNFVDIVFMNAYSVDTGNGDCPTVYDILQWMSVLDATNIANEFIVYGNIVKE